MHGVAGGRLHDDTDERLRVPSDERSEFAATIELRLECIGREPVTHEAFGLHHCRRWIWCATVDYGRQPDKAFASNRSDLDHIPVAHGGEYRTEAAAGEVHVFDGITRFVQYRFQFQRHDVKQRTDASERAT